MVADRIWCCRGWMGEDKTEPVRYSSEVAGRIDRKKCWGLKEAINRGDREEGIDFECLWEIETTGLSDPLDTGRNDNKDPKTGSDLGDVRMRYSPTNNEKTFGHRATSEESLVHEKPLLSGHKLEPWPKFSPPSWTSCIISGTYCKISEHGGLLAQNR